MYEKYFTLEEAEKLIPEIEQIMRSVLEQKQNAVEIGEELAALHQQMEQGQADQIEPADLVNKQTEMEFLVRIINESLLAIEEMGAQPKDLDLGLVDFPSLIDGEEVLLCWKYGEKRIEYYHDPEEGYAGRKRIPR